jgi:predicted dehydrogenase
MKCILTGLGGPGLYWLGVMRQRDDVEVVGFVEPFQGSVTRAIEKHGVEAGRISGTMDEAIAKARADGEVDFILDVTPPAVHHEVALKAFENGLHVLGEKPLSDDFETAKKVVEAGEKAGVRHMLTQNYRFGGQPRSTRAAIQNGQIGTLGQCDIRFYMNWAETPSCRAPCGPGVKSGPRFPFRTSK